MLGEPNGSGGPDGTGWEANGGAPAENGGGGPAENPGAPLAGGGAAGGGASAGGVLVGAEPAGTQNCQPAGGGGQLGSGTHPGGGTHPSGCAGQPGGGLNFQLIGVRSFDGKGGDGGRVAPRLTRTDRPRIPQTT
jgi:hypothetical protein